MKNNLKKIFFVLFLFLLGCITAINADDIYLKDGRVIKNVSNLQDTGNYFLFQINGKSTTYSKQIIEKVTSSFNQIIFEHKNMTAEKINSKGVQKYSFFLNEEKVGEGCWNSDGEFEIYKGSLPEGTYNLYFDNGKLERTFPIKNNTINGTVFVYYNTGRLAREGNFVNGYETGESKLYYKTGELKGKSLYKYGKKNGLTTLYYESGKLKAEMNFSDGKINGLQKMYFENSQLSNIVNFNDGEKDGEFKQFYENGKLKVSGNTKAGKLNGAVTVYYESGRVKSLKNFIDGRILHEK